ncbi:MAG: ABC transporter ATP-binding protein [Ardenticatenales bacterium]|nr:ABC transporter ATP-binding protein [Ardenticatenales bacterium]
MIRLMSPQIIGQFLEGIETKQSLEMLWRLAFLFVVIAFVEQGLAIVTTYVSEDVAWKATNQLRKEVAAHCLKLDLSFHQKYSPGTMVERLDGDITALSNFFSQLAFSLFTNLLLLGGVLVLLTVIDWRIGLIVTAIAVGTLIVLDTIRKRAEPHWQAVLQANAELYGYLEERFKGTEEIRSNGATDYVLRGLYRLQQARMQKEFGALPWLVANLTLPTAALTLATVTVFVFGDYLHQRAGLSVGNIYVLYYYVGLLGGPLWQVVNQIESIQLAGASIGRIQELRNIESKIKDGTKTPLTQGPLRISFQDLVFRYDEDEGNVLSDINLTIYPCEVVSVLGRTGSGKSTLSRLLIRQIDATSGIVSLANDGAPPTDIREISLDHLRHRIGVVTQEVQLFRATLRDNLTFFNPSITDQQLQATLTEFGLGDWLNRLPAGLDTIIGAGGQGLSDGEAQLIAFLRVFQRNPSLVILDEASSRLDPITEGLISQAVARLLQGRTGIVIAHRLKTIKQADKVIILEKGRIVEQGSPSQLANDPNSRLAEYLKIDENASLYPYPNNHEASVIAQ